MMKILFVALTIMCSQIALGQNVGIVRKNYFSTTFDSLINMPISVFDSVTIRLGSIDALNGTVSHLSSTEYNSAINLNGATIDPYQNHYYIGSGFNLLTFDINSGDLLNNVPISGSLPAASFQNYRFNPSDSTVYGMVPHNYYSTYYDSIIMSVVEVFDSAVVRFASIDPSTGTYSLIGNASYKNIYTLAGNSVDPFQMVYYFSAVDTLIGVDLYSGNPYSVVPIQLPQYVYFENITYSCADTSIYGLTRQNYTSLVYDSLFMDYTQVIDSTTFRLSKIDPNTGIVTFISPFNIQAGGNLTGGAFIDPNSMTYYFNNGNTIVGVSLVTGLVTSTVNKTYPNGEIAFDMMRSTQNCLGATKMRQNTLETTANEFSTELFPNPVHDELTIRSNIPIESISIIDIAGKVILTSNNTTINIGSTQSGVYFAHVKSVFGDLYIERIVKD